MSKSPRDRRVLLALVCAVVASQSVAEAVTHTWTGGFGFAPSSNMNNSNSWGGAAPTQPPTAGSNLELIFPFSLSNGSLSTTPIQNFGSALRLQRLNIVNPNLYTFSGNGLQFENLGANPSIVFGSAAVINFPLAMSFVDPTTITHSAATALNITGALSGTGGAIFVSPGGSRIVTIGGTAPSSLAGTSQVMSGVTLQLARGPGNTIGGIIEVHADGVLQALPPNQFSSGSHVKLIETPTQTPTLLVSNTQTLLQLTMDGGVVNFNPGSTLAIAGSITSNSGISVITPNFNTAAVDLAGGARTIAVNSTGATELLAITAPLTNGSFIKTGPGVLQLTGASHSLTGASQVNAGTLRTISTSIGDVINQGLIEFLSSVTPHTGNISGSGSVLIPSGGFAVLSGNNSYTGGTTIDTGGTLFGNTNSLTGVINSSTFGTVNIDQNFNGNLNASVSGLIGLNKSGTGTVTLNANSHAFGVNHSAGGLALASDQALGTGTYQPFAFVTLEAIGNRTLANVFGTIVGPLTFAGSGNMNFTDLSDKNQTTGTGFAVIHSSTGTTTLAGRYNFSSGAIVVNAGQLVLGNPTMVGGFLAAPGTNVTVNGGTLKLQSQNFISLPDVTLTGGTLDVPNGYAIPLGAVLAGNGAVTGRVASANGSTIIANGPLSLGSPTHPAGVNLDGELYSSQFSVTLLDSNQAVLGSYTELGNVSAAGTLNSANGIVLNFGRNLVGWGTVNSTNTLARAVIINGDVAGTSIARPVTFNGYVKGVGTFDNTIFAGTFAPGLSPALLTVGSIGFAPTNVLDMEIGGLLRGGQYDAIDATGSILLNGQLKLTLINSFNPTLGNQFDLFDGTLLGTFSSFNFPPLLAGLYWDTSLLYSNGIVQVSLVPEPATLAMLAALPLLARRRRC